MEGLQPEKPASVFNLILERVGFGIMGAAAGLIYSGVALVVLFVLKVNVQTEIFLKSFATIFGIAGFLGGESIGPIVLSSFYGLMYLWGALLSVLQYEAAFWVDDNFFPKRSSYFWCAALGFISMVAALIFNLK